MFALDVPPTTHLFNWPSIWGGDGPFAVNKIVLIFIAGAVATLAFYLAGARKRQLVPTGLQNLTEVAVEFIENGIILQTMGPEGLPFAPFLLTIFSFILTLNMIG